MRAEKRLLGHDLARCILKLHPDLPVVLMTGFGDAVTREACASIGIRELIMKPVTAHDLGHAIRVVLGTVGSRTTASDQP